MKTSLLLALAMAAICVAPVQAAPKLHADPRPLFVQMADEVANKMLESPQYQDLVTSGKKPRIVVGDVRNNTDDEGIRVEDLFNQIRETLIASGTARLFAEGELKADFVISPVLTNSWAAQSGGRRQHCFELQLNITTISGEYVTAPTAHRCE